jgi:hypothetical protein
VSSVVNLVKCKAGLVEELMKHDFAVASVEPPAKYGLWMNFKCKDFPGGSHHAPGKYKGSIHYKEGVYDTYSVRLRKCMEYGILERGTTEYSLMSYRVFSVSVTPPGKICGDLIPIMKKELSQVKKGGHFSFCNLCGMRANLNPPLGVPNTQKGIVCNCGKDCPVEQESDFELYDGFNPRSNGRDWPYPRVIFAYSKGIFPCFFCNEYFQRGEKAVRIKKDIWFHIGCLCSVSLLGLGEKPIQPNFTGDGRELDL